MKKIIDIIQKKWLRDTFMTIVLVAIIIAFFIVLNLWVQSLNLTDLDVTKEQLYTLSDESKKQIEQVNEDVKIYFFGYDENSSIVDLAKQYSKANNYIQVEVIDVSTRPDLSNEYGISEEDSAIVVNSSDRNKILTSYDLYSYDYTTYEQVDLTEQKLTNSIIATTIENTPTIYFLTGHDEYSVSSHMTILSAYLENEVNTVKSLDLLVQNEIPADCSALVIASAQNDFTDFETELITNYINSGGKILWFNDPSFKDTSLPNTEKILSMFGVNFDNSGIIFEQDSSKMVMQSPNIILPDVNYSDITSDIMTDGGVMLLNSGKLIFEEDSVLEDLGASVQNLINSSDSSFYRTNLSISSSSATDSEEEGPFTVGALITKKISDDTNATLIAFSNNLFATDYAITINSQNIPAIYLYNNKDLVLNSISYLTDREDTIIIRKDTGTVTYTATQQEDNVIRAIIFGVPVCIILAGIVVWQIRRRKR